MEKVIEYKRNPIADPESWCGWVATQVFHGGYYSDYGGHGFTREHAIELYQKWQREDCWFVHLHFVDDRPYARKLHKFYEDCMAKGEELPPLRIAEQIVRKSLMSKGIIASYGQMMDKEYRPAYGGWDLH